jgi:4-hydroxy-tetrahydrodipicolinate reductase
MGLRVCVAGATGWAGKPLTEAILKSADLELVATVSRSRKKEQFPGSDVIISGTVEEALKNPVDVFVDYTRPEAVKQHVLTAVRKKIPVVIGTSGLLEEDFADIDREAVENHVGVIAGGNFSITAILLEHFAKQAARYLSHWEILDLASSLKPDAPSGVSRQIAARLAEVREPMVDYPVEKTIGRAESRGTNYYGTQIHSVRLPGYVIELEIIFSEAEERLVIRHEAGTSAEPYIKGALLAIRKVRDQIGLVRGLDHLLPFWPTDEPPGHQTQDSGI